MPYLELRSADQLTDEIIDAAYEICDGWYQSGRIDWENVIDRLDGMILKDGSVLDMGEDMLSPAIQAIKARIRRMRAEY